MQSHSDSTFAEEGYSSVQGLRAQGKVARCGQGRTAGQPDAHWLIFHLANLGHKLINLGKTAFFLVGIYSERLHSRWRNSWFDPCHFMPTLFRTDWLWPSQKMPFNFYFSQQSTDSWAARVFPWEVILVEPERWLKIKQSRWWPQDHCLTLFSPSHRYIHLNPTLLLISMVSKKFRGSCKNNLCAYIFVWKHM